MIEHSWRIRAAERDYCMRKRDDRSRRIFEFICHYTDQYGFPPTLGEIAADEGYKSNSGVIRHLDKLEKWGWIERYHGNARSIRILRRERPAATSRRPNSSQRYLRLR